MNFKGILINVDFDVLWLKKLINKIDFLVIWFWMMDLKFIIKGERLLYWIKVLRCFYVCFIL